MIFRLVFHHLVICFHRSSKQRIPVHISTYLHWAGLLWTRLSQQVEGDEIYHRALQADLARRANTIDVFLQKKLVVTFKRSYSQNNKINKNILIPFYQDCIREGIVTKYLIHMSLKFVCANLKTGFSSFHVQLRAGCAQWQTTCQQGPKVWFPKPQKESTKLLLLFFAQRCFSL